MTTPNPTEVAPWYLRNINQALALDEATGNVYLRTNNTLNVSNVGNVYVNDVSVHDLGNIDISNSYMPVSVVGNVLGIINPVTVTGNVGVLGNVTVAGNVSITSLPEVEIKNDAGNPISISKNTTVNSASNRIYVSQETDLVLADSNYYMNVARGLVDSQEAIIRSAYLPDSTQNVETSVWVEGGIYPFASWTVAQKLYVISTSAADTGQTIYIEGLDANYDYQTETITTNGTTAVATVNNYIRIWTATVTSASSNSANTGEITFRLTSGVGTVVAHISASLGITKLSQFTVPRNYNAYVQYGDCTTYHAGAGNVGTLLKMMVRPFNGSFVVAFIAEVAGGNPYRNDFTVPMKLTEKSDVDVRVTVDTSNTKVTCNWQMILIPN